MTAEVYILSKQLVSNRPTAATTNELVGDLNDRAAIESGWPIIALAAWSYLWGAQEIVLFEVKILGITLLKKTAGDLRNFWRIPFGPCPFKWETGPYV